jgi:enoyl-CoA hydratase
MSESLRVEVSDRIGLITITRPETRNALDGALLADLVGTFEALDADDSVDVLVLTGSDPAFCAGLNLRELEPGGSLDIGDLTHQGNPWPAREKPLVGAINGPAVTGGLELALYCDVLIASERARFADTHARVGIVPFWGMTHELPMAVGRRNALAMSMTGNFLDATEAHLMGLVFRVVAHEDLVGSALAFAADIVSNDQAVVRALLAAYRDAESDVRSRVSADEKARALAWQGQDFDAAEFARRRAAIAARGRSQAR